MNRLIPIKYNNPITYGNLDAGKDINSDFFTSQFPVSIKEYREITEGKSEEKDRKIKKKATWLEAIKYCNLLNIKSGLPLSYDEITGRLIDEQGEFIDPELDVMGFRFRPYKVKGFRLPTFDEWEYAAKGWTPNKRCDCYYRILENLFRWLASYHDVSSNGTSEIETMQINTIGLYGMLGNDPEWHSDNDTLYDPEKKSDEIKNKMCYWEEYYRNYNNDPGYQLSKKLCDDTEMFGFRVAINRKSITSTQFFSF